MSSFIKNRYLLFIISITLSIAFTSCLKLNNHSRRISYYNLVCKQPEIKGLSALPWTLRIHTFSSMKPYNTRRIIYRKGNFVHDSYAYHRWIATPGDMISQVLIKDFRNLKLFKAVIDERSQLSPSFTLEGSVEEFAHISIKGNSRALIRLNIILIKNRGFKKEVIFQNTYSSSVPCTSTIPEDITKVMSLTMESISKKIIIDTYQAIKGLKE